MLHLLICYAPGHLRFPGPSSGTLPQTPQAFCRLTTYKAVSSATSVSPLDHEQRSPPLRFPLGTIIGPFIISCTSLNTTAGTRGPYLFIQTRTACQHKQDPSTPTIAFNKDSAPSVRGPYPN